MRLGIAISGGYGPKNKGGSMFICLSSGASPRYRQDILRAVAMPKGSQLQFRYDSSLLASGIRNSIREISKTGGACLIAYIDQSDQNKEPELIPCRFARLSDVEAHGTTVSLTFIVEDFAHAANIPEFNSDIRKAAPTLPVWKGQDTQGDYWLEIKPNNATNTQAEIGAITGLEKIHKSTSLADWEKIVSQLAQRADFANETYFYTVTGIYPVGAETAISLIDGKFELASNTEYELRIYHFHPDKVPVAKWLRLHSEADCLRFTTNRLLSLDSRYDLSRIRFKTERLQKSEAAVLSLHRLENRVVATLRISELDRNSKVQHRLPKSRCIVRRLEHAGDLTEFGNVSFHRSHVQL